MGRTTAQAPAGPLLRSAPSPSQARSPWTSLSPLASLPPESSRSTPFPGRDAPLPWSSAPTSGDTVVHIHGAGREGSRVYSRVQRPPLPGSTGDLKCPLPAKSWHLLLRTPPAGTPCPELAVPDPRSSPCWMEPWVLSWRHLLLTPNLPVHSTRGPSLDRSARSAPLRCRPQVQVHRVPIWGRSLGPGSRGGKLAVPGLPSSPPGPGRSPPYPRGPRQARTRAGRRRGPAW